jgi:hypothetical protein
MSTYAIRVVCCYCKIEMGEKPTCDRAQHGKISHGACPPCAERGIAEAKAAAASFQARQLARRLAAQTATAAA